MDDAVADRAAYRSVSNQEIDMQPLNTEEVRQVHGAGALESALTRWYLYTLAGGGTLMPMPIVPTQF